MNTKEYEAMSDDNEVTVPNGRAEENKPEDLRILEALLFASDELMTATHLKAIIPGQPDARKIRTMVEKINMQLQKERHPFEIVEIGGGYQFRTITFYHPWVRQIFKEKAVKKLSIQALECLAIIAYKQPISKAEIEAIRGVVSDGAMKTLLEKKLVTISGRSEKPGRPLLYATTNIFLTYFGLNKIEDLPRIEEFEVLAREKMEELSMDELRNPDESFDENTSVEGNDPSVSASLVDSVVPGSDEKKILEKEASPMIDEQASGKRADTILSGTEMDETVKIGSMENLEAAGVLSQEKSPVTTIDREEQDSSTDRSGNGSENTVSAIPNVSDVAIRDAAGDGSMEASAAAAESDDTDAVFEVDVSPANIARFSEEDIDMLGGALMETKAIATGSVGKKSKKEQTGSEDQPASSESGTDAAINESSDDINSEKRSE